MYAFLIFVSVVSKEKMLQNKLWSKRRIQQRKKFAIGKFSQLLRRNSLYSRVKGDNMRKFKDFITSLFSRSWDSN